MATFTSSTPSGHKAEIWQAEDGYSVFTWIYIEGEVRHWEEFHGLDWASAFDIAHNWLNPQPDKTERE